MLKLTSRVLPIVAVALALCTVVGREARGQMSAPLVGLIADGSGSLGSEIRPILGVLGASSVREPVRLPGVSRAYLAPAGGWALVRRRGSPEPASLGLVTFTGSVPSEVRVLDGAIANPDLVSFSPTGRSAALLSRSTGAIQILVGLDGSPQVSATVSAPWPSPEAMAVSDDGGSLVVLAQDGHVCFLSGTEVPQMVAFAAPWSGMVFLPNRSAAVVADGSGTISLLSSVQGVASVRIVAGGLDLSGGPVLVQASRDGSSAFVAVQGGMSAYRVDLANGSIDTAALPVPATRLDRLRDGESFVVSAEPGRSAWFLVGNESGLGAVFAPVVRGAEGRADTR